MKYTSLLITIILNLQYSPLFSSGNSSEMPGLSESTAQKTASNFNFLQTKFPHLVARINEPYKPGIVSEKIQTEQEAQEITKFLVQRLAAKVNDPGIYQEPYPKKTQKEPNAILLQQEDEFRMLEKNHSKEGFFKIFFQQTFKNHNCLEEILLAAEYMYETIKSKNDDNCTVLFLGRSPCLLQKAYELILEATGDTQQHIAHVNFSSHPNANTLRTEDKYHNDEFKLRNVVTPARLSHFFNYLDTKPLLNRDRIYIVDCMGFGNGLNSFLNILKPYFSHHKTDTPKLDFMLITDWIKDELHKNQKGYTLKRNGNYCDNNRTLTFPANISKNIVPMSIETHIVPCREYVIHFIFDSDVYQTTLYHGIDYPTQRWSPEHDKARDKGAPYSYLLYPWFTQKLQAILGIHMKMLPPFAKQLGFLGKKHPELKDRAEAELLKNYEKALAKQDKVFSYEEYVLPWFQILKDYVSDKITIKAIYKELFAADNREYNEANHKTHVSQADDSFNDMLKKYHPMNGFYKLFFKQQEKEHSCSEDYVLAAEYLYQKVKDVGDENSVILFLGRSPSFIQTAFESLQKGIGDTSIKSIQVNYSGHPDVEPAFDPNIQRSTDPIHHLVTPDRLQHYFSYLDTKNIQSASRIFIVDILESGAGLNSFITLLNTYYETKKCPKPDLRFMCVTSAVFPEYDMKDKPNYKFTRMWKAQEEFGQNNFTLTFVENKERNLKPHVIQTHLVPIRDYASYVLDLHAIQQVFSRGYLYPAINWHPKFDQLREKGAPLSQLAKDYLEKLFVDVIDNHLGIMEGMSTRE